VGTRRGCSGVFIRVSDGSEGKRKREGSARKGVATPRRESRSQGTRGRSKGTCRGAGPVTRKEREKRGRTRRHWEEKALLLGESGRDGRTPRKKEKDTPRSLTPPASLSEVASDAMAGRRFSGPRPSTPPALDATLRLHLQGRSPTPPFRLTPLVAVCTCSRQALPEPATHAGSSAPKSRQFDEGRKHPSDYNTSPQGVDTGISPSEGRRLPPLRGGPALSSARAGPRPPGAHWTPPTCDPSPPWEGSPPGEGVYLNFNTYKVFIQIIKYLHKSINLLVFK
jgi:hypothetical protein